MSVTGNMAVVNGTAGVGIEILNRPPYEGVPVTIDDDEFASVDVIKAGSLIDKDGKVDENGAAPVGVLLFDVYKGSPQGTILKKAYVNLTRVKQSIGDAYTNMYETPMDTVKTALPMIVFEEEPAGE